MILHIPKALIVRELSQKVRLLHITKLNLSDNRLLKERTKELDRHKLRNVGIIAHINAGKTTTTERILYHAGSTETVGDVDKGNTVTDYLVQERDRGITITSAAVTYNWKKHRINLIDTPGHVDFTIEVERSLSVLDGAVTIIDSSAGVEAQTITVWNQATKYKLPNIIFLNKYDKPAADYKMCMKDLKLSLDINPYLVQIPIKEGKNFSTILDLIKRTKLTWTDAEQDNGSKFVVKSIVDSGLERRYLDLVEEERERLINRLSDIDDVLASHVLECDKISDVSSDSITEALGRATLKGELSPVLVGSSFKYIGVQQLMDAIVDYLPSPIERENQILTSFNLKLRKSATNCAFIFKIMHDKRQGPLAYARICNGSMKKLQRLKNLESGKAEQVKKIHRVFADELKEIDQAVEKDDIVVITGLSEARTGDILVDQQFNVDRISAAEEEKTAAAAATTTTTAPSCSSDLESRDQVPFQLLNQQILLPRINQMEPVYFCSIESRSSSQQLKLEHALSCLAREDPSFSFEINELGLTTIKGMGKLHIEVARDRIASEYGIDPLLGPLQISYRETIDGWASEELAVNRLINSVKNTLEIKLYLRSLPKAGVWNGKMLRLDTTGDSSLGRLRNDHRKAIESGFMSALSHGPSLGYPVIDCDILLLDFKANSRCGLPVISSSASQCLMNAIQRCSPVLLEPIMLLEVVVPKEFNGPILGDLQNRRGLVLSTTARSSGTLVVRSQVPLATLGDYSEYLRVVTSGRGSFSMELHSYTAMSELDKQRVVRL